VNDYTKLELKPGDLLIVKTDEMPSWDAAQRFKTVLKERYPFDVLVLWMSAGSTLETMPQDEAVRVLTKLLAGE
jgi:hypothetical protein